MANHDAVEAARSYLLSAESVNAKARLVEPLADLTRRRQELESELAEVDRALAKAHETARKGGWKPAELTDLGYPAPRKPRGRRPRKASSAPSTSQPAEAGSTPPTWRSEHV